MKITASKDGTLDTKELLLHSKNLRKTLGKQSRYHIKKTTVKKIMKEDRIMTIRRNKSNNKHQR